MQILIVRIGRAGDIVMTTPAIRALLKCYPEAKFTVLTSPDGKRLLKNYSPSIIDMWIWDKSSKISSFLYKKKLIQTIKNSQFDEIFCFETNKKIHKLFRHSTARLHKPESSEEEIHSSLSYLNVVNKACDIETNTYYANLPLEKISCENINIELQDSGITKNDLVIAMHPTFSGYSRFPFIKSKARKNKLWSAKKFAELGKKLSEHTLKNGKHPVIIIDLLENESSLGKDIVKMSSNSIKLLTQPANMERYKALLSRVDILISPDTGPMHIAAAVNTRIVALFSGKSPNQCGPYMPKNMFTVVRAEDISKTSCGIDTISVEHAFQACIKQLNQINTNNITH